ncbi:MAG: hypothetical protein ACR2G0_01230 [Chthoniobacterales bacterium]
MESPASPSWFRSGRSGSILRGAGRWLRVALEIAVLSGLILGMRCANFPDVFVQGKIYFVDADCYARMTRVRLVAEHPGVVVRQHDFENYPTGIRPHTTAPFDYLILLLAILLRPWSAQALDLAGALVSPVMALAAGWFLYWWTRRLGWLERYLALLVYALSAILGHGTSLGRPDQQSLLIVTLLVGLGAEWRLAEKPTRGWAMASGLSWGLALWVSLYEPLILLVALLVARVFLERRSVWQGERRIGWWILLGVLLLAAVVERRWPSWPMASPFFGTWAATIGELKRVSLTDPALIFWCGGLLLVSPLLLYLAWRARTLPRGFVLLVVFCFGLTLWQARWGYFLALLIVLTIPAQLAVVRGKWWQALLALLAIFPLLQYWDRQLWPNDETRQARAAARLLAQQWRGVATALVDAGRSPIMTPWWLAPAITYWSGQPSVAGSSHESLPGIVESARFYLSTSPAEAAQILRRHQVRWVLAGDGEAVGANSAALLGVSVPPVALCRQLELAPAKIPPHLQFVLRNGGAILYEVSDFSQKSEVIAPTER